jgi:hypothetical protein
MTVGIEAKPRHGIDRRKVLIDLLRLGTLSLGSAGLGIWLDRRSRRPEGPVAVNIERRLSIPRDPNLPDMAIIQGETPRQLARAAVEALGGIRRFISRGDVVVVKPNIGWDRTPEQAANTNPDVVAEIVRLSARG